MSVQMLMQPKQPQVPFVDLGAQYRTIAAEINEATSRVIQEADFILGREVSLFEEEFAAFCEAKYAVGVDSGTSALELALRAYDIGPGDEVITAANTFIAGIGSRTYVLIQSMSTEAKRVTSSSATCAFRTPRDMSYDMRLPSSSGVDVKRRGPIRLPASSASRISVLA